MSNSEKPTVPGASASGDVPHGTASRGDSDLKDKGRQTADEVRNAARAQAEGVFDQQKGAVADQAQSLSSAFQKMAEELDAQHQDTFSGYANNLARTTDSLSRRLREQNLNTLMHQARDYSRRQPAIFLGGALTAGFLMARFFNSSQQNRSR